MIRFDSQSFWSRLASFFRLFYFSLLLTNLWWNTCGELKMSGRVAGKLKAGRKMLSLWFQSHFLGLCSPAIYIGALETNAWGGVGRKCIPVWRGSPTRALSQLNFGSNPNPTAWLSHSPSPIWKFSSKEPSKGRPEKSWDFVPSWGRVYDPMPNSILKSMAFKTTKRQNAFHFFVFQYCLYVQKVL